MWKYVLKRLGLALVTAYIVISLSFLLIDLLPYSKPLGNEQTRNNAYMEDVTRGYVKRELVKTDKYGKMLDEITVNGKTYYYYETPALEKYFNWLGNIITEWDWGDSVKIAAGNSATSVIFSRMPTTIKINLVATLVSVPLGLLLGIIAALKKNTAIDHIISTGIMIFISIPSFILITLFIKILAYDWGWVDSDWPSTTAPLLEKIKGYIIPTLCLSFGSICGYARFTRAELCEVMESDYLLLARTKGLTRRQAITRHALRNAMVPIVPSILAEVIGLLGGSMILENLYGIPGVGKLYVEALGDGSANADLNVLFLDMALYTAIGLVSGVFLDISYGFIDPRIRMGAKK